MNNRNIEQCLKNSYSRESFISLAREMIPFEICEPVPLETSAAEEEKLGAFNYLGKTKIDNKGISLLEVKLKDTSLRRSPSFQRNLVAKYLKLQLSDAALVAFYSDKEPLWKLSLVTVRYKLEDGKPTEELSEAKRFSFIVGENQTVHTAIEQIEKIAGKENTYQDILDAFSIEKVTKDFFIEVSNWYAWALDNIQFPEGAEEDKNGRKIALIRFLTRFIFIWFMKQKDLIPDYLFDKNKVTGILNNLSDKKSTYYKAILQNLFFATLSTPSKKRTFRSSERYKGYLNKDYMVHNRYRYQNLFKNSDRMVDIFEKIPFLNGGLFECLDKSSEENNNKGEIRIDGFSDKPSNSLKFPNKLFFSPSQNVDLNNYYGTKNKSYLVKGLINTLRRYNFTIEESTPVDIDIALDPELLGKVFENLLASYNPETATTARKATGSYYTPREIVHYMADESLKAYFKTKLGGRIKGLDEKLEELFSYNTEKHSFDRTEAEKLVNAIDKIRIIDPAVGSGAFPMGILQRLVHILSKLDSDNKIWRELQKDKILKKIDETFEEVKGKRQREQELKRLNEVFERNTTNYGRKLYLIKNCIYGVDIQPIAVQIAKLRFFISLLVDMKIAKNKENLGIKPLPNLETRFVAANTLIKLDNNEGHFSFKDPEIKKLENKLKEVRNSYFSASDINLKNKFRNKDEQLREEMGALLKDKYSPESTQKIIEWNPYDSDMAANWFEPEWMFGIKEGFDIVIANPPYVNIEEIDSKLKPIYSRFSTAYQKYDLYILFFEKGLELVKNKGNLIFITSNKYFSQGYGLKLRQLFLKNQITRIINFNYDIFESSVVRTAIIQVVKQNARPDNYIAIMDIDTQKEADKFFKHQYSYIKQEVFNQIEENNFRINLTNEKIKILEKIGQNCLQVDEICSVNYGLRPSSEKLGLKKESFIYGKKEKPHFKKYFEGKNMGYWLVRNYSYLDYCPDIMYNPMFDELFRNEKLVGLRTLSDIFKLRFIYDNQGFYCNDSVVVLTLWYKFEGVEYSTIKRTITRKKIETSKQFSYQYLQSILNSRLIKFYVNELLYDGTHFYPNHMKILPIKKTQKIEQQPYINKVDQILDIASKETYDPKGDSEDNKKVKALERQIDQLVYKLYDLTPGEIKIVEESIK